MNEFSKAALATEFLRSRHAKARDILGCCGACVAIDEAISGWCTCPACPCYGTPDQCGRDGLFCDCCLPLVELEWRLQEQEALADDEASIVLIPEPMVTHMIEQAIAQERERIIALIEILQPSLYLAKMVDSLIHEVRYPR